LNCYPFGEWPITGAASILPYDGGGSRCSWKLALTDTSTRPQIPKLSYS